MTVSPRKAVTLTMPAMHAYIIGMILTTAKEEEEADADQGTTEEDVAARKLLTTIYDMVYPQCPTTVED